MSKLHVAVLRGGPSSEYDVSLKSGAAVLKHMPEKYHAHDIFISKDGTWHRGGLERTPNRALAHIDVVFNALHGEYGEDGKVQKILDHLHIPYTGSGSIASSLGMNKVLSKKAFERHKLKTPFYKVVKKTDDVEALTKHAFHNFFLPLIIKPANAGSSVGVTLVKDFRHIEPALKKAFEFSDTALMEEYIRGREATCGVVDNFRGASTYPLLPIEIIHSKEHDFFNYDAKYGGGTQEICPGNFTPEEKAELQYLAQKAHEALGLRHYSRSDFIVTPRRGIYILEVNTLPGLTTESLLPKSLEAIGCTFPEFLDHLITLAKS